jgi:hypothetical protein
MPLLSANIILCENVLTEKTEMSSAIRLLDVLRLAPGTNNAHLFAITRVYSQPGDFGQHTLRITANDRNAGLITQAPDYRFQSGYRIDPSGPGGFVLTTEFNIDVSLLRLPTTCVVNAFLDSQLVAHTPLTLSR